MIARKRDRARIGIGPARRFDGKAGIGDRQNSGAARGSDGSFALGGGREPGPVRSMTDHDLAVHVAERGAAIASIAQRRVDLCRGGFGRRDRQVVKEQERPAADANPRPLDPDLVHRNTLEPAAVLTRRLEPQSLELRCNQLRCAHIGRRTSVTPFHRVVGELRCRVPPGGGVPIQLRCRRCAHREQRGNSSAALHSHSIVPGGFDVQS